MAEFHPLIDPFAIHFSTFVGDVYTLDTASITLTTGTLTANTLTDGTASLSGGNLTSMGNITGSDVDISAGTGNFLTSGAGTFGQIIVDKIKIDDNTIALNSPNDSVILTADFLATKGGTITLVNSGNALGSEIQFRYGTAGGPQAGDRIVFFNTTAGADNAFWTINHNQLSQYIGTFNISGQMQVDGVLIDGSTIDALEDTLFITSTGGGLIDFDDDDIQTTGNVGIGTATTLTTVLTVEKTLAQSVARGISGTITNNRSLTSFATRGLDFIALWKPSSPAGAINLLAHDGASVTVKIESEASEAQDITSNAASGYMSLINATVGAGASGAVTITNAYNFKAASATVANGGVITNLFAFYDTGQTVGATNWGFYGLSANNFLSGKLFLGQTDGTIGIYSQADGFLDLFADGAVRIGDSSGGAPTNYSEFETDGTLEFNGTATVFEDIVISLSSARVPAANAPTWSNFISNLNEFTYGLNDFQEFSSEIAHSYKEGSTIEFHVHGATNGQEGSDKTIKYEIEYELIDNQTSGNFGDVYTGTTIINGEITIPSGTADKTAWVIDIGTDATGNLLQGATLKGRVRRIASTGTEPVANPFTTQVGVHIELDTVGSRTELTK